MKKVLIVDDSKSVRLQMSELIAPLGSEVLEAENGSVALELMLANKGQIGLVFLDLNMPEVNGIEFLEQLDIHVKNGYPPVPVVMLTTESNKANVVKAKTLGVRGWIIKPISEEVIKVLHKQFMEKKAS